MGMEENRLMNQFILVGYLLGARQGIQGFTGALGTGLERIGMLYVRILQAERAFVFGVPRLRPDRTLAPTGASRLLRFDNVRGRRFGAIRRILASLGQLFLGLSQLGTFLTQFTLQPIHLLAHLRQQMLQCIDFGSQCGTSRAVNIGGGILHAEIIGS